MIVKKHFVYDNGIAFGTKNTQRNLCLTNAKRIDINIYEMVRYIAKKKKKPLTRSLSCLSSEENETDGQNIVYQNAEVFK